MKNIIAIALVVNTYNPYNIPVNTYNTGSAKNQQVIQNLKKSSELDKKNYNMYRQQINYQNHYQQRTDLYNRYHK